MKSKRAANILFVIALIFGLYFLHQYLGIIALAALTTLLFAPLHDWLTKKGRHIAKFATGLTIGAVLFSLLLPLFTLTGLSFYEGNQVLKSIKDRNIEDDRKVNTLATRTESTANSFHIKASKESIKSKVQDLAKKVVPGVIGFIFKTTGGVIGFISSAIVYFIVLATMLSRKYELVEIFKRLSPFDDSIDQEYLSRIKSMAISMVKGTFIIALTVALISSATLWAIDFPYIIFWFMLFTIMSLIPLGAGIIFVPIGVLLVLTGSFTQGILVIAVQFLILNNIDNILRPRLAPKDSNLPGVLILLSTFAGVGFFGILGVVYGPVIMVLIYTTIELYDRHKHKGLPLKRHIAAT